MLKRYTDCKKPDEKCTSCSISSYGKDCHNAPTNKLSFLRHAAGLSQAQLSEKSGIYVSVIGRIERDERNGENMMLKTAIA
ncbi:MAG: helix-turn-helix transcriptional regulator [Oscillospiraceae bacterium]